MNRRFVPLVLCLVGCLLLPPAAGSAQELAGCTSSTQLSYTFERVGEHHYRRIGAVEIECNDFKFFAEQMELFTDTSRLIASGNVVFTTADHRIGADRVEFDTRTRTGTFFNAAGSARLGDDGLERSMFGSQEPDAYFYGQTIEKLGPKKYRLSRGAFTTCVQPTPRWEIVAGSVTINLDDYALLTNSVLRVKGVPLLYMPIFYYPLEEDDRSTGFLIPTYGVSTLRGQSISNAFFWAIGRSYDATVFHDWFSKTGQGVGAEYRHVRGPGSDANVRTYLLTERPIVIEGEDGTPSGRRSYEIRGSASQGLGSHIQARGRVDYFSDIEVQQTFHTDIFEASRRQRSFGGNLTGSWGGYTLSGTFERNETFFGQRDSTLHGATPRILFTQADRPILGRFLYLSLNGEYAALVRRKQSTQTTSAGLSRLDVNPVLRVPFTRWPFLTINSSVGWRNTYWTDSLAPGAGDRIDESVSRRYFDFQTQITGPVFMRIFDTPSNGYAERWKHVIEPAVSLQRVTGIDVFERIVQFESLDSIVGDVTSVAYGVTTRLYAKAGPGEGASVAREILAAAVTQSYYTDARASQFDRRFRTSFNNTTPSNFSPVALVVRATPSDQMNGTFRAEYDTQFKAFRTMAADGTLARGDWLQTTAGWSQRRFIQGLRGFDDPSRLDHYLNTTTTLRTPGNRVGGIYSFNYDLLRQTFLQQRVVGYYNAQCCGVTVEFQSFNFAGLGSRLAVAQDRRFNVGFTLAGIGTFSNFFGALGGEGQR